MTNNEKIPIKEEIVVASLDVLGMGKILDSKEGSKKALHILNHIFQNTVDNFAYKISDDKPIPTFGYAVKFGDSIYLIGDPNQSIEEQTSHLILRVSGLIMMGVYRCDTRFLLRAGIARGDLIDVVLGVTGKPPNHVKNVTERVIIGNSMSHANYLEECQLWIGGAVSGDLDCKSCMNYLVKYDIPLDPEKKIPKSFKPKYAINWLKVAKQNDIDITQTNEIIDAISKVIGRNRKKDNIKIKRTKEFVDYILKEKLYE